MDTERFCSYSYNGQFDGNIMVVGRTGCGKTTFIQNLGRNRMFGSNIYLVYWVSKIKLSAEREHFIRESFPEQTVKFAYPNNLDEFNYLIDLFMSQKVPEDNSSVGGAGEKTPIDKLIVMDDVSGPADKWEDFSNLLTVSRKYGFSCLYVFHTIYPGRQSWEMIMSQTHIFNFFPGSIHSGRILKTLSLFASREKNTYVPTNQIWLNRLYFQISNSQEKNCLTIDTRDSNEFGPGKFRTRANNAEEQYCYFNRTNTDSRFKRYLAKRDWNIPEKPVFSITEQQNYSLDNNTVEQHKNSRVQNTHQQLTNGRVSETGRFTSTENSDGTRPQTETGGGRTGQLDATESTAALRQRLQV